MAIKVIEEDYHEFTMNFEKYGKLPKIIYLKKKYTNS